MIGHDISSAQSIREALELARLDWRVTKAPVFAMHGQTHVEVPDKYATIRTDNSTPLGVVGARYEVVQNDRAFSTVDAIVREGNLKFVRGGDLDGGSRVWLQASMGPIDLGRDSSPVNRFLLFANSHDGTTSVTMGMTPVRVVCQNTLNLAMRGIKKSGFTIKHTKRADDLITEAQRALGIAHSYYDAFAEEANRLLARRFTDDMMKELGLGLIPKARTGDDSTRSKNRRDELVQLFTTGKGHGPIAGTAWAALNAAIEFSDHARETRVHGESDREEGRVAASWFGSGAAFKQQAYDLVNEILDRN